MTNLKQKFFDFIYEGWVLSPMGGLSFVAEGNGKVKVRDEEEDKNIIVTK